jgi:hypothetical protein
MNDQPAPASVVPAPNQNGLSLASADTLLYHDERMTGDLARLLRYALTTKDLDVPKEILEPATKALQCAKAEMIAGKAPSAEIELQLFDAIDALTPRVYPATIDSLEIGEIMEIGKVGGTPRQVYIRKQVNALIARWIWSAVVALVLIFMMSAAETDLSPEATGYLHIAQKFAFFVNPILLGFLGACAYILRNILQGIANQSFVLRDGTNYTLRSILGMILGFMIPYLFSKNAGDEAFTFFNDIAVPFLAGYAVEPMFAAMDNIVMTIRDAVSHSSVSGAAKPKA